MKMNAGERRGGRFEVKTKGQEKTGKGEGMDKRWQERSGPSLVERCRHVTLIGRDCLL